MDQIVIGHKTFDEKFQTFEYFNTIFEYFKNLLLRTSQTDKQGIEAAFHMEKENLNLSSLK